MTEAQIAQIVHISQIFVVVMLAFVVVAALCLRWLLRGDDHAGPQDVSELDYGYFARDREWAIRHMEQGPSEPLPHAANESIMRKAQQNRRVS